ncbi:hypothetical protein F5Y14DRAFT_394983 [Nemania sp. NC0429]|nr:hypothetical protein F5Y14DRAFT_394983 [Nemania sp. NC0429]
MPRSSMLGFWVKKKRGSYREYYPRLSTLCIFFWDAGPTLHPLYVAIREYLEIDTNRQN